MTNYQEDNVDTIFSPEIRLSMCDALQKKSSCKISNEHLNSMIQTWKKDIREGYRTTTMTIELPSLLADQLRNLKDNGNQEKPKILQPNISTVKPKFGALPPLEFT
ncbi:hypothetical protein HRE53_21575 [Acaryochloris sp. 'Moss Beach']|uniref:hypothetical protein n=1 Tax=Acaryochloris sp. 'Moss Beach' TaxID=2740837 RepID=UPI001F201070|nr:hypothetical protein [Acaryochloris sp. 'Moss Beach']UJB68989.1 hypothetical protein HRE53_21575 [Acaryochloris sp. 'Moss Beach']